jgi:RNA polymerase sigma-70 factor (ECF subfamily)
VSARVDIQFRADDFIQNVRSRNHQAIEELVRTYTGQLLKAGMGLGFSKTQVEEVVQDVWKTFYDIAPRFEGKSHVRTFLFGILYKKGMELRRQTRRFDDSDPIEEILDRRFNEKEHWINPPINPEQFSLAAEKMEAVEDCLGQLPLQQKEAFLLKEVEDFSCLEICEALGIKSNHLGVILFRARNRLRECLEGKAVRG